MDCGIQRPGPAPPLPLTLRPGLSAVLDGESPSRLPHPDHARVNHAVAQKRIAPPVAQRSAPVA